MTTLYPHVPVLLDEILQFFKDCHLKIVVDCTLGGGGHSESLLKTHPEIRLLAGIDQDPVALDLAKQRLDCWKDKTAFMEGNFAHFSLFMDQLKIAEVDGILLDLGVSSMQLNTPEKGFSFMHEGPLDMRMDPKNPLTAADIVNTWSEEEIARIFRDYGEDKQWRLAARVIAEARRKALFTTTTDLSRVLLPVLSRRAKKGIHPLTLIFQGLRIAVNAELEVLEELLPRAVERLRPGGRLAIISFHSLEDRIVKNILRYEASDKEDTRGLAGLFLNKRPTLKILTKKPIIPLENEILRNPRSRSAKLRVAEKL
jgi:16S rRNA (cytosine1402-N4)-methyltransferase